MDFSARSSRPSLFAHVSGRLTALRRMVLRRRRLIAMVLIAVATFAALRALAPPAPATASLRVAAHDLPAGAVLDDDDLVEVQVPPDTVPDGIAASPRGRILAAAVRAGEPLTDVRLVGADLAAAEPPDTHAAPVRLSDAGQAALLSPGDRIDLLATDPKAAQTRPLALGVTVLAVPSGDRAADGALPGRLIVVALHSADVDDVTTASVASYVTYTWSRS